MTPDVLVVGAGPAGALAALAAARAGARVTVAERATFPRPKVCGSCLSEAGIGALRDCGAMDALAGAVRLRAVRLVADGRELAIARDAGVTVGREALDARLAAIARDAGAEVRFGVGARAWPDGSWTVGDERVAPGCTVVADGLAGRSLDAIDGFGWRVRPASRMGLGAVLAPGSVRCTEGEVRMHVARDGYVGAVALPDGTIDVAAAADPAAVRAAGGPGSFALAALGPAVTDRAAFLGAEWRGTPTLTRSRARLASARILVAGDAAGYVEPFTGEGMGWAMATGAAAGALAARVVRGAGACDEWPRIHASLVRRSRVRCRAIALALRSPAAVKAAITAGSMAPALARRVARSVGSSAS
jgi:flavin-dependent dehydrogenase